MKDIIRRSFGTLNISAGTISGILRRTAAMDPSRRSCANTVMEDRFSMLAVVMVVI